MRAPLSWLRDFAPFPDDVVALRAALDDLGLVVEAVEHVGEGLGDVVVSRVTEISPIEGADRIRRVVVDAGPDQLEIVCGAHNFAPGDRVPLAPVGTILPDGTEIARRTLRGVESNGMLCSGKELGLSDDGAGLLVLGDESPGEPGTPLMEALGLQRDIVFDITVEGNRPDAWSMVGIARDLAGRLGLPFAAPEPPEPAPSGWPVEVAATASVVIARPLPPPHRDGARPRQGRSVAAPHRRAAAPRRHASDQQRGRRLELRHARDGPAHAPLRPFAAARTRAERPAGPAG